MRRPLTSRCVYRQCTYINETDGVPTVAVDAFTGANLTCFAPAFVPLCDGNGEVKLPYGNAAYVGLGFVVFCTLLVVELFGCALFPSSKKYFYLTRLLRSSVLT